MKLPIHGITEYKYRSGHKDKIQNDEYCQLIRLKIKAAMFEKRNDKPCTAQKTYRDIVKQSHS